MSAPIICIIACAYLLALLCLSRFILFSQRSGSPPLAQCPQASNVQFECALHVVGGMSRCVWLVLFVACSCNLWHHAICGIFFCKASVESSDLIKTPRRLSSSSLSCRHCQRCRACCTFSHRGCQEPWAPYCVSICVCSSSHIQEHCQSPKQQLSSPASCSLHRYVLSAFFILSGSCWVSMGHTHASAASHKAGIICQQQYGHKGKETCSSAWAVGTAVPYASSNLCWSGCSS